MARAARRAPRRKARKARRAPRRNRVPRSLNPMNQHATLIETVPLDVCAQNVLTPRYFSLNMFPRSVDVAYNFKYYRAAWVEWTYTPLYNTFQEDAAETNVQVPYMYTIMNRTQDSFAPATKATAAQFIETQGAKPKTFTKKIVLRYKPNWTSPGLVNVRAPAGLVNYVVNLGSTPSYKWLSCPTQLGGQGSGNTYGQQQINLISGSNTMPGGVGLIDTATVVYNGHYEFFDQVGNSGTEPTTGHLSCTVKWEFKNPGGVYINPRDPAPTGDTGATGV